MVLVITRTGQFKVEWKLLIDVSKFKATNDIEFFFLARAASKFTFDDTLVGVRYREGSIPSPCTRRKDNNEKSNKTCTDDPLPYESK